MEKIAIVLFVVGSLLSGCVAYDDSYRDGRNGRDGSVHRERERERERDRDRDGVPNRQDRYPDDSRRY